MTDWLNITETQTYSVYRLFNKHKEIVNRHYFETVIQDEVDAFLSLLLFSQIHSGPVIVRKYIFLTITRQASITTHHTEYQEVGIEI